MVVYVGNFIFGWFIVLTISEVACTFPDPCVLAKHYWCAADA